MNNQHNFRYTLTSDLRCAIDQHNINVMKLVKLGVKYKRRVPPVRMVSISSLSKMALRAGTVAMDW